MKKISLLYIVFIIGLYKEFMRRLTVIFIGSITAVNVAFSQVVLKEPLSARQTYYKIDARLQTAGKIVEARMETYWVNKSADKVTEVQMHLYLNAFRSRNTTFNKESRMIPDGEKSEMGWIDIKALSDRDGNDLLHNLKFISPDDGNANDSTVAKIDLPAPAMPGDTVFLKISFESKLPSRIIRTGSRDDFFFVGQWFPKFGVYESTGMRYAIKGGWNCHQFHANSEFYSNHSVYDVNITLPENYVVGSGGLLLGEANNGNGEKTLNYRAEDIVDFAWTAWPYYIVFKDQWQHVDITLLLPPERKDQADRQFTAVKNALEFFDKNAGPYPWPHLTIIDPPVQGNGAAGMEYTTLFTSLSFAGVPACLHLPEMVTVHEFGHAYFMGILASNEFEEPWLDEGVNQFWEARIMDNYYGKNSGLLDHPLLRIADRSYARAGYVYSGSRQVTTNNEYSWNYPHRTYSMMSYTKAATILHTLMGLVGEETTNEIFREYYRKWAFKHPAGKDFINVVNEVVGKIHGNKFGPDMNWFFDQTIYGDGICDYKVIRISNARVNHGRTADSLDPPGKIFTENDTFYEPVVELERAGDVILPVEIQVRFENGENVVELWDGKARYKDLHYSGRGKVEWVKIDPEYKIMMDVNWINNSMTIDPDPVPVRSITGKLTTLLQFFISAITF